MTPRPTKTTLFPYTTLFRSLSNRAAWARTRGLRAGTLPQARILQKGNRLAIKGIPQIRQEDSFSEIRKAGTAGHLMNQPAGLDRKSTRLNSSHPSTSNAAFG